jgi:hypothetical protein
MLQSENGYMKFVDRINALWERLDQIRELIGDLPGDLLINTDHDTVFLKGLRAWAEAAGLEDAVPARPVYEDLREYQWEVGDFLESYGGLLADLAYYLEPVNYALETYQFANGCQIPAGAALTADLDALERITETYAGHLIRVTNGYIGGLRRGLAALTPDSPPAAGGAYEL